MPDHVHLYLSLPADLSIAQLVSALKANSSRWIHETFPRLRQFAWQQGYAAFSVSRFSEERLIAYIRNQEAHHLGPKGRHPQTGRPIREDGATHSSDVSALTCSCAPALTGGPTPDL